MALSFNNTEDLVKRDQDFVGNGVLKTTDFPLAFPEQPDMTFEAGEGIAWVDGYRVANDATAELLTVEAADAEPRIDIVQVGFDAENTAAVLTVKKGVAGAEPVEPDADAGCIKLYAIRVAADATAIAEADVEDRRELVPMKLTAAQIEGAALLEANTFTGVQNAPGFVATSEEAPLRLPQLASVPEAVGAEGTLVVVDGKWYVSNGAEWKQMADVYIPTPATADQLGSVMIGSGVNVDEDGVISVPAASVGAGDNQFTGVQTAPGFVATSEEAPLQLPNLEALPETVGDSGTMCIVDSVLYVSNGTEWAAVAADELLPATATRLGGVKIGEGINVANDGTIDIVSTVLEPMRRDQINFIDLAIEVETMKAATLNGVTANIFIETFRDLNDILLMHGSHDSQSHKVYLV